MNHTFCLLRKMLPVAFLLFITNSIFAQIKPDTLTQSVVTIRNTSSETFYYGLCEGDQIVFSLNVLNGQTLKNFEFNEYPGKTIYAQSSPSEITSKQITINHTDIYYFSLHQSGFLAGKRSAKLVVVRKPANVKAAKFNTTVYWKSVIDTVWYTEDERYLVKRDTLIYPLADQLIKLGKKGKKDKTTVMFTLPAGTDAWSWWIGNGSDAVKIFTQAQNNMAASQPIVRNQGLMTHIALGGGVAFSTPPGVPPLRYAFLKDAASQQKFTEGTLPDSLINQSGVISFGACNDSLPLTRYIALWNDKKKKTEVCVRITAVRMLETWGTRQIKKYKIEEKSLPYLKND
ncbi:MAG: hypothetical protein V2A54_15315 [Bacteroidota bacterium]